MPRTFAALTPGPSLGRSQASSTARILQPRRTAELPGQVHYRRIVLGVFIQHGPQPLLRDGGMRSAEFPEVHPGFPADPPQAEAVASDPLQLARITDQIREPFPQLLMPIRVSLERAPQNPFAGPQALHRIPPQPTHPPAAPTPL